MEREEGKKYVASISYGKDSLAMLEAIKLLEYPLDEIVYAELWATDDIPAQLPEMVEFQKRADEIIYERYGLPVTKLVGEFSDGSKLTFEKCFYRKRRYTAKHFSGQIYGWPMTLTAWCVSDFKKKTLKKMDKNAIQYVGLALDEKERRERSDQKHNIHPLADIGWTEEYCMNWCRENDLLSPIYETRFRDGCFFCPKQNVENLRLLRHKYPDLWELMMKWDYDSPGYFKTDGKSLHLYDKRFWAEDNGLVPKDRKFRWKMLEEI